MTEFEFHISSEPEGRRPQTRGGTVWTSSRSRWAVPSSMLRHCGEVEVESVAYIVCDALGLDASGYSFPYVARWAGGSDDLIKETAGLVIECAKSILESLVAVSDDDEEMDKAS
jgi:hypothetical protein